MHHILICCLRTLSGEVWKQHCICDERKTPSIGWLRFKSFKVNRSLPFSCTASKLLPTTTTTTSPQFISPEIITFLSFVVFFPLCLRRPTKNVLFCSARSFSSLWPPLLLPSGTFISTPLPGATLMTLWDKRVGAGGGGGVGAWQQHFLLKGSRGLYVSWAKLERKSHLVLQLGRTVCMPMLLLL